MSECHNVLPIDADGAPNWIAPIQSFSDLSPNEIVALSRNEEAEHPVTEYLDRIAREESDRERLGAVMAAFLDSPLSEDRKMLAYGIPEVLIRTGLPEFGMAMWDRLLRDEDKDVRRQSYERLRNTLEAVVPTVMRASWPIKGGPKGFYAVDLADERQLAAETGLTRQDAYDLMLSHAYAENGDYFNLGRAALTKLQAVQPPTA